MDVIYGCPLPIAQRSQVQHARARRLVRLRVLGRRQGQRRPQRARAVLGRAVPLQELIRHVPLVTAPGAHGGGGEG